MHDLSPFVDRELDEHRQLHQVIADRIEVLERIGSLARQLDALTHRALAPATDLQTEAIAAGHRASLVAAAAKAATAKPPARAKASTAKAKPARAAKPAKPKTKRAAGSREVSQDTKAAVLAYLQGREDPVGTMAIAEALGVHRSSVDNAIKACNGQVTCVQKARGPHPALYLATANLELDSEVAAAREAEAQQEQAARIEQAAEATRRAEEEAAFAEREAERAAGLTTAPTVPPVSPRVARELAREGETAGDHQDVQPDNLSGRVLRTLQDNGGMRVRDIADQLKEDPPVIAKVVSDHIKSGNIRKNSHDGTYYAVGQMATA